MEIRQRLHRFRVPGRLLERRLIFSDRVAQLSFFGQAPPAFEMFVDVGHEFRRLPRYITIRRACAKAHSAHSFRASLIASAIPARGMSAVDSPRGNFAA
ncbi:MAG: hypothetical protein ACRETH_06190 [Steroidobacteraceae bacterium]